MNNDDRWPLVRDFALDDPTAQRPFSTRLRDANQWTDEFTAEAIGEYRKFMFLCRVAGHPLTPSVVVDSVWHMHLLYSRNYLAFCEKVIGRFVHHDPGKGNDTESERFSKQYIATLVAYRKHFGSPPESIWGRLTRRLDTGSAE